MDDDVLELNEDGTFDTTTAPAVVKPVAKADAWSLPEVPASVLEDAREQEKELHEKEEEEDKTPARESSYSLFHWNSNLNSRFTLLASCRKRRKD